MKNILPYEEVSYCRESEFKKILAVLINGETK